MMQRNKCSNETYSKYFYEKMTLLNNCKISGIDAVSCLIEGIDDNVVKTSAKAGNHQRPESLFQYLSTLNDTPGYSGYTHRHSEVKNFQKHKL